MPCSSDTQEFYGMIFKMAKEAQVETSQRMYGESRTDPIIKRTRNTREHAKSVRNSSRERTM